MRAALAAGWGRGGGAGAGSGGLPGTEPTLRRAIQNHTQPPQPLPHRSPGAMRWAQEPPPCEVRAVLSFRRNAGRGFGVLQRDGGGDDHAEVVEFGRNGCNIWESVCRWLGRNGDGAFYYLF